MRVILETLAGMRRIRDACDELGICEQRFETLRTTAIQAGIEALELRPAGRPPKLISEAQAEVADLRERIAQLEAELAAASIRAELATTLPRVGATDEKKIQPRSGRARKPKQPRPGAPSSKR
jgi:hypothetical protein